jgi:hypothetical protein
MTSTAPSMLELLNAIDLYFQGEKIEALVFILPIGLLSLVFSAWLFTDGPTGFARGVAIPFLLVGLLMTTVGGVVGYRTPQQVSQLQQGLQTDPQAALANESQRMQKVNAAWSKYMAVWALMGVLGLALRLATSSDFSQGVGIAMVLFAGVGLMVDGFAERRAHAYASVLAGVSASSAGLARPASR